MTTIPYMPEIGEHDDVLSAALKYASAGLYVIPIDQGTKKPASELGKHWQVKSSREPDQLAAWFAGTSYGIGLHVGRSGVVAFDVDYPDRLPEPLWKAIQEEHPPHQSTRTGNELRGHFLFRFRNGRVLGNGVGKLGGAWGEIRGRGGQIVAAPSVHPKVEEGGRYRWLRCGPIPELPSYVDELLHDDTGTTDGATDEEVRTFLAAHTASSRPGLLSVWVRLFEQKVSEGESRHQRMLSVAAGALKEARLGFFPAKTAMDTLEAVFLAAVASDPLPGSKQRRSRSGGIARSEWRGISAWAVAEANAADLEEVRARVRAKVPDADDLSWIPADSSNASGGDRSPAVQSVGRTPIDISAEPDAVRRLTSAIGENVVLPGLYVRDSRLVWVREHSAGVEVTELGEARLRRLLAEYADCYRMRKDGKDLVQVAALPSVACCSTVLAGTQWKNVPPLKGVVTTPVLRPDGTVLAEPGYDPATGLLLASNLQVPAVPQTPDESEVAGARELLLGRVLVDFPWVEPADRANYLALLLTTILRPYIGGLSPLGAITAPERGAGKSLLADIPRLVYGGAMRAYPPHDEEMGKAITAMLLDTTPVLIFDNVPARQAVEHPSLAALLTMTEWSDRLLGHNRTVRVPNDRLWLATGTNLRLGGDMAQRTVLVRIDPRTPNPDRRSGFSLDPLNEWVRTHRGQLLHALLVLARAWTAAGAPRDTSVRMRDYTPWAAAMGGLLAFHGVEGFLANREEAKAADDDIEQWSGFLAAWQVRYGDRAMRVRDLRADAEAATESGLDTDWAEVFPKSCRDDRPVSAKALAAMLREHRGRYYGGHRLDGRYDTDRKTWLWSVTSAPEEGDS